MRRRAALLIISVAATLVVAGGVALAATISCKVGTSCVGTDRADTMTGTNQADSMKGRGGGDTMYGRDGGDDINGGDGIDEINAGLGDDELYGGPNPNTLSPEEKLSGGAGDDSYVFEGGWGDDKITDGESSGKDTLVFSSVRRLNVDLDSSDGLGEVYADGGLLHIHAAAVIEDVEGGATRDVVRGNDAPNGFLGKGGNDSLLGGGNDDALFGGLGADVLNGGPGNDALSGSSLGDIGDLADISDVIDNDVYIFQDGWGRDSITDAAGTNHLFFGELTSSVSVTVRLTPGEAYETASGSLESSPNSAEWTPGAIQNATGGAAGDFLYGDASANTLNGYGGDDEIHGGNGVDDVSGDAFSLSTLSGNDTIDVADGDPLNTDPGDTVDCGPGADTVTVDAIPGLGGPVPIDTYNQENCETVVKDLIGD
jgi:Ca2+-binding RTX toxin-like protein